MRVLWQYLKPYKKQLIVGPAFKLTEAILEILVPTIMAKYLIDIGIKNADSAYIFKTGALMLALAVIGLGCALICQYNASVASQGFGTKLRSAVYEKITSLSFKQLDRFGSSTLLNRITGDINVLQQSVAMIIRLVIRAPFIVLGSFVMASIINLKLGLIILGTAPVFALIIFLIMRKTIPLYRKIQKKLDNISNVAAESFDGVRVIRAFAKKKSELEKFELSANEFSALSIHVGKISAILNPATLLVLNFLIISVLWAGGLQVNAGGMTKGDIIAVTTYISYIMTAMLVVADLIILFIRAGVAKDRICELLLTRSDIKEGSFDTISDEQSVLEFKDVSFSYNGEEKALESISFKLNKGESLGIIGGIGSGKSTVVNLISRFYDVDSGVVMLFGRNIKDYRFKTLRSLVSVAMQKPFIFSGTIKSNILQGKPDADESEVLRAAEISQAKEFIERLENGFDSVTEAEGRNLSGGQKQRLSLARAIISGSPVLILDDSCSALDYATELSFRKALKENYQGSVIMVSQRVSTIKDCSKIIVLEDGKLSGIGTHEELLKSNEEYKLIYTSQTKREVE